MTGRFQSLARDTEGEAMILALLYTQPDTIAAAAPACDQTPYGDRFWQEIHPAGVTPAAIFETAYVEISDRALIDRLLQIGIQGDVDGKRLASEVESLVVAREAVDRAA